MPHEGSYIDRLKFDPKLWNTIQAKYLTNFRLVFLLIISIIVIGIVNYFNIPRRLNPAINIPIVTVVTVLPGAGPQDVEQLITIPIEDKLTSLEGVDTMTSVSRDNVSATTIQFLSTVNGDKAKDDVQSAVDSVTSLPSDAQDPSVTKIDFEDEPVWTFVLVTDKGLPSLMRVAKELKDKVEDAPKVDRVIYSGYDDQEIEVIVNPTKIKEYNISPLVLSQAISRSIDSYPAGNISANGSLFSLTIDPKIVTVDDIRSIRITANGQTVNLSDIAEISEKGKLNQNKTFYADDKTQAKSAVQFFVYKTKSTNIDAAEKDVKAVVEETLAHHGDDYRVITVQNTAELIITQFNDLIGEFQSTIILVFIVLLVFLGLRQAVISSFTVPLTFLSAISVMNMVGLTLNFLTLFAFLIALGLLIDDTIVSVAAMTRYYSSGKFTPQETGLLVWRDFIVPLWSTTITTIWAFVPLLLATGIIGEFIRPIPIVVTATMLSSTSIAVLITIPLMMIFLKPNIPPRVQILLKVLGLLAVVLVVYFIVPKSAITPVIMIIFAAFLFIAFRTRQALVSRYKQEVDRQPILKKSLNRVGKIVDNGLINTEKLSERYMNILRRILSSKSATRKTLTVIIIFALVAYLLVPFGLVKNEFFPKTDEDLIYVNLDLPAGTNLQTTTRETQQILNKLRKTEDTSFVLAETGTQFNGQSRGNTVSSTLFTLHLYENEERDLTSIEIAEKVRQQFENYTKGTLTVVEISGGPPAGADLQIKLLGDDLKALDSNANKIMTYLKKQPGVINVDKSIKSGTGKIVFVPDETKLSEAGLTPDTVGLWLRTFASGFTLDKLKVEKVEKDIVFRLDSGELTPEDLGSLYVTSPAGQSYPLLSLGTLKLEENPTAITREEGKRSLSVSAGVQQGYSVTDKNKDLEKFADSLNLPSGYSWKTGGVNEENNRSVQSIFQAMGLSFMLILITMIIEFGSYRQAVLTILTIPLAVSGVFYIFGLMGIPLSFPALIGILALFGIVVTNAIVVVEKINDNRREGMNLKDSVIDASGSRLEPVLLTSIATIAGLLPITLSDPLWRGLGGAIIAGLFFSGIIKLFFVPIMYYLFYKGSEEKTA